MAKPTLYLMLGYPGSGKTTTARAIHRLTGAVHLWADQERQSMFKHPSHSHEENLALYRELNQKAGDLLAAGSSVIFDTNFSFYKDREHLRRIAAGAGAETRLIWVRTPKEIAKERATTLIRNSYPEAMPEAAFDRMSRNLQPPREDEEHITVDGTRVTDHYVKQLLQSD